MSLEELFEKKNPLLNGIPTASYVMVPPLATVKIKVPGYFFFRTTWFKIVPPVIRTNIGNRGATDKHR